MLLKNFSSGANRVSLHNSSGKTWVEKRYEEKLTHYPVCWPVSRGEMEAALLNLFAKIPDSQQVRVPHVYGWEPAGVLSMEYCPGKPLVSCSEKELERPALWKALFSFLYDLRGISREKIENLAGSSLRQQEVIQKCMLREKIHDEAALTGFAKDMADMLCLGDLSLNNILLYSGQFWLIDLECGHWGKEGYDAGQLLAMSCVCWKNRPLYSLIENAFLQCIPDPAYQRNSFIWRDKFIPFYEK